jgi:hypothetical protein
MIANPKLKRPTSHDRLRGASRIETPIDFL